jgi:hypothetical protein
VLSRAVSSAEMSTVAASSVGVRGACSRGLSIPWLCGETGTSDASIVEKTRTYRFRSIIGLTKVAQHNFCEFARTTISIGLGEDHPGEDDPPSDGGFKALLLAFLWKGIKCGGIALWFGRARS